MAVALAQAGCDIVGINIVPADETAAAIERMGRRFHDIRADLGTARAEERDRARDRGVRAHRHPGQQRRHHPPRRRAGVHRARLGRGDRGEPEGGVLPVAGGGAAVHPPADGGDGAGRIINVASLLSFQGGIRVPSYTAAKSGVPGLTRLLANEWAKHGITVNAIAPGYMATNNTAPLRADPARSAEILGRIPLAAGGCRRILRDRWCSWPPTPRPMSPATPWRSMGAGWHAEATVQRWEVHVGLAKTRRAPAILRRLQWFAPQRRAVGADPVATRRADRQFTAALSRDTTRVGIGYDTNLTPARAQLSRRRSDRRCATRTARRAAARWWETQAC